MNYIDEIFMRADFQQIREFLLQGCEAETDPRPYKERLERAQRRVTARLREVFPDLEEYEEMTGFLFDYVGLVEAVYMEIGLQVGAILSAQVCQNLKSAFAGD